MKLASRIWFRAIVIYFCCMLPTLLCPIIFFMSMGLALMFGIPALLLFLPVPGLLRKSGLSDPVPAFILIVNIGMLLCFAATYGACAFMADNGQTPLKAMQAWLAFPLIAWAAALCSLLSHYTTVKNYFGIFKETSPCA